MATAVPWEDDGDWELINDDGFVYKRKKRSCPDPTAANSASAPPPLPDPAVEERNRRQRKKSTLLKLKERYQKEILQWEHLSNTLSAMQRKAPISQQPMPQDHSAAVSSVLLAESRVSPCQRLVDELLSQAEAQEVIIQDVSNLCDIVEVLCSAKEDRFKQTFTELPVWESPRKIISSLCDEWNNSSVRELLFPDLDWNEIEEPIMKLYTEATDGSNIERKESALAWHHQEADPDFGTCQAKELLDHLEGAVANEPAVVKRVRRIVESQASNAKQSTTFLMFI